ncbi:MAG: DUF3160 domain-containing protein [Acidobacteriota bacterium]
MRFFTLIITIVLISLTLIPPATSAQLQEPFQVTGLEQLNLNKEVLERLAQQGFVVLIENRKNAAFPYLEPYLNLKQGKPTYLPPFITADMTLRAFQTIYEEALIRLEEANAVKLLTLIQLLVEKTNAGLATLPPPRTHSALERNLNLLQLTRALLDPKSAEATFLAPAITEELTLISRAAGSATSPLLGCVIDYRVFQLPPELHSTNTRARLLRTLHWLNQWNLSITDDIEARQVLLLTIEFALDERLPILWQEIDSTFNYFYGPMDALNIFRLIPIVKYIFGRALISDAEITDTQVATFQRLVNRLEAPRNPFKLLGRKSIIESEILQQLIEPAVVERPRPSGLDVAALLGSQRAWELAAPTGKNRIRYYAQLTKARQEFTIWQLRSPVSHYNRLLDCLKALLNVKPDGRLPEFSTTPIWQDRILTTVMAGWAGYHHLPTRQPKNSIILSSITYSDRMHGYVEPNSSFFAALATLAIGVRDTIAIAHIYLPELDEYIRTVGLLQKMAEKELAAIDFSEDEIELLENYGEQLIQLQSEGSFFDINGKQGFISLIKSDRAEKELIAAVGQLVPFFIIVSYRGERYLCRGAAFTYHEFTTSNGPRTDAQWSDLQSLGDYSAILPYQRNYLSIQD